MNLASCLLRKRSLSARIGWLCAAVVPLGAMVCAAGFWFGGAAGAAAALAAGAICLVGAVAALCATEALSSGNILAALVVGMALRMGLPLGLGLALQWHDGPLAQAGLLQYLLACYPITLAVETILSLPATGQPAGPQTSLNRQ